MCPYIASLSMYTEYRLEAFPVWVHWRPVTFHEKIIISQPLRQVVVMHHHPAGRPYPPRKLFGFLESSWRHGQEVQSAGVRITWTLSRRGRLRLILPIALYRTHLKQYITTSYQCMLVLLSQLATWCKNFMWWQILPLSEMPEYCTLNNVLEWCHIHHLWSFAQWVTSLFGLVRGWAFCPDRRLAQPNCY